MGCISFVDNVSTMGKSYIDKSYEYINEQPKDKKWIYLERGNLRVGYGISENKSLSNIYEEPFYVVRFEFHNIESLHSSSQLQVINDLLNDLKEKIYSTKGYYVLRVPTHIMDLIKSINIHFKHSTFCGGTVEYIQDSVVKQSYNKGLNMYLAKERKLSDYIERLSEIALKSFENYQSQYHIADYTQGRAREIYKKWALESVAESGNHEMLIVEVDGNPVAFYTFCEEEFVIEGLLTAVDEKYRGRGIYKNMLTYLLQYAFENKKYFATSTQFDNFITQTVWQKLELKLFFSIYNFHINNL